MKSFFVLAIFASNFAGARSQDFESFKKENCPTLFNGYVQLIDEDTKLRDVQQFKKDESSTTAMHTFYSKERENLKKEWQSLKACLKAKTLNELQQLVQRVDTSCKEVFCKRHYFKYSYTPADVCSISCTRSGENIHLRLNAQLERDSLANPSNKPVK